MDNTQVGKDGKSESHPDDVARQGLEALFAGKDHVYSASAKTKLDGMLSNLTPGCSEGGHTTRRWPSRFRTKCQGRSKTRPVWRSKSRPVDSRWLLWDCGAKQVHRDQPTFTGSLPQSGKARRCADMPAPDAIVSRSCGARAASAASRSRSRSRSAPSVWPVPSAWRAPVFNGLCIFWNR